MTAVTNQEARDTVETGPSLAAWRERAPAIVVAIVIIALWEICIDLFSVPIYIAPSPLVVAHEAFTRAPLLFQNMLPTLMEALVGFFAGNGAAVLFAILLVHNRTAERGFYPIAVFVHSIPILAIAPILVLLFGTGYAPFRGGPLNYARSRGPGNVVEALRALAAKFGGRFTPDAGWDRFK